MFPRAVVRVQRLYQQIWICTESTVWDRKGEEFSPAELNSLNFNSRIKYADLAVNQSLAEYEKTLGPYLKLDKIVNVKIYGSIFPL